MVEPYRLLCEGAPGPYIILLVLIFSILYAILTHDHWYGTVHGVVYLEWLWACLTSGMAANRDTAHVPNNGLTGSQHTYYIGNDWTS